MTAMLRDLFGRVRGGSGLSRLRWWICFSGALHLVLIVTLLVAPTSTARRELPIPVYTVDLVAGPAPLPRPAAPEPKPAPVETLPLPEDDEPEEAFAEPVAPEPPKTVKAPEKKPPPPKEKIQVKKPPEPKVKEAPPKKPKKKAVKRKKPAKPRKKAVAKPILRKKGAPKRPRKVVKKSSAKPKRSGKDTQVVRRLRQTRIEDAVATAKERAKLRRKIGLGQDVGAGAGVGGTGTGGLLKGREFVAYLNGMRDVFKERWTWIGKRRDLEATVSFGVRADGEIFGLKLLKPSGDAAYDESVVRAVRRSVLPPPPRRYAREFAEVEFTFRPDSEG